MPTKAFTVWNGPRLFPKLEWARLFMHGAILSVTFDNAFAGPCADSLVISGVPGWAAAVNGLYVKEPGEDNSIGKRYVHGVLDGQFILERSDCLGGWVLRPASIFVSYAKSSAMGKALCADAWLMAISVHRNANEDWCLEKTVLVLTWGVGDRVGEPLHSLIVSSGEPNSLIHHNPLYHAPQYTACWKEGQDKHREFCCRTPVPIVKSSVFDDDEAFSCLRKMSDRHGTNSFAAIYDRAVSTGDFAGWMDHCFDDKFLFDECCGEGYALSTPLVVPASGTESASSPLQIVWEEAMSNATLVLDVPSFVWSLGVNSSITTPLRFHTFKLQSYDFQLVCDEFFIADQYHILRRSSMDRQREFLDFFETEGEYGIAGIKQGRRRTRRNKMLDGIWANIAARMRVRVVLDVGASFGFFSVVTSHLFPAARILAVEANPLTYRYLLWNLRENGVHSRVDALHAAVVIEPLSPSRMYICWPGAEQLAGMCHHVQHGVGAAGIPKIRRAPDEEEKMQLVPGVSFDALLDQLGVGAWVDPSEVIVKIDCEGCETAVFTSRAWHRWKDKFLAVVGELHDYARNDGKEGLPCFSSFAELAKDYPPAGFSF